MSDMYKWLDIVKQGMQHAADAEKREAEQKPAANFNDDTAARASVYTGEIEQQQHYNLANDEHVMTGKPDLQAGQTIIIDQLYGPGAGHGVFVAYSLDGNSAICNVDSVQQSIPIEFVSRDPADVSKVEFQSTGSEGAMSPLSAGEKNRADLRATSKQSEESKAEVEITAVKQSNPAESKKDSQMEDLEKWMRIIEEGPVVNEGYSILPNIDKERYTDLSAEGLEGPFMTKSGKVVYYDPREGKYYDRDSDFYISHEEYAAMNESSPKVNLDAIWQKIEQVVANIAPDGDPIDYLAPWLEKQGLPYEIADKAARKHGYADVYAYYDEVYDEFQSAMHESACGCASYDCTSCFPMNEATEVADEEDADGEFDTVIDVNEGVNGDYPDYGSYPVEVENGRLPGIPAGTYNLMFDADVRVLGKYYPATRYEPAEYPEAEVEVTYVALWDTKSESDDPIITSNDSPKVQQELFSLVPNNAIEELEQDALAPKDDDDYDDGGYDQDADWEHFADSKQPTKAPMNESKTLKENKMKLKEFGVRDAAKIAGTVAGNAAAGPIGGAVGGYAAGKVADKIIGSNEVDEDDEYEIEPTPQVAETDEWEEEPINGFGAADELDDVDGDSDELSVIGAHDAGADVSELIGVIDHIQNMGMSMSDRHYDVDKLISMRPEMIKRIYDKVKGVEESVREADDEESDFEPEDDEYAGLDRKAADMTGDAARSAGVDLSSDKPAPVSDYYSDDGAEWGDDDADASLSDVGDELDGIDEPEVEVPAASARGASMDVSDMLGKIAYMQDMGMSLSDRHYDTEKLMMMAPEVVQRVYSKVVGESKKVSSDMFISTLKESKKTKKPAINEGADPDVIKALKALFE